MVGERVSVRTGGERHGPPRGVRHLQDHLAEGVRVRREAPVRGQGQTREHARAAVRVNI